MTTPQSAGLEQRARELLAAEYERAGYDCNATAIREGVRTGDNDKWALRAIEAALAAPAADGVLREVAHDFAIWLNKWRASLPDDARAESYSLHNRLNQVAWETAAPQAQGEGDG